MTTTVSLGDALLAGAKEVFETMIFMSLEQCSDAGAAPANEGLLGTITFRGNIEGCVGICCSSACARSVAANMLGMEPGAEMSESEIYDAIGEVTNMIMGSFKARIIESVGDVQVSIPSVIRGTRLDNVMLEGQERVCVPVMLDEHVAVLSLLSRKRSSGQ
jgi:chemotaxis protein CheX